MRGAPAAETALQLGDLLRPGRGGDRRRTLGQLALGKGQGLGDEPVDPGAVQCPFGIQKQHRPPPAEMGELVEAALRTAPRQHHRRAAGQGRPGYRSRCPAPVNHPRRCQNSG